MTTRSIVKGTFRLSIVVAVLAAIYGIYERLEAWGKAREGNLQMLLTLECGAKLSETTLKSAVNQYGNIDLGKVGCADKPFMASFGEIERTRTGAMKRELTGKEFDVAYASSFAFSYAMMGFGTNQSSRSRIGRSAERATLDCRRLQIADVTPNIGIWRGSLAQQER